MEKAIELIVNRGVVARILIVAHSAVARDPRVLRQVHELRTAHQVTVAGLGPFRSDEVDFVPLPETSRHLRNKTAGASELALGRFESFSRRMSPWEKLKNGVGRRSFDLVLVNDVDPLPSVLECFPDIPILLDAHEYYPDMARPPGLRGSLLARYRSWLTDEYMRRATSVITVSDPIANEYSRRLDIERPTVIPNVPRYRALEPVRPKSDVIEMVHHGMVGPARGIDVLIRAAQRLPDSFRLHLYLVGQPADLKKLTALAAGNPQIVFHEPVATTDLPEEIHRYDVGVFCAQPVCLSDEYALPNKFFENIQGRLAQVTTPMPAMKEALSEWGVGYTVEGFGIDETQLALRGLNAELVWQYKLKANEAAQHFCWESFAPRLHESVASCLDN